jgi:flavin-dependent dehydrogenase
MVNCDVVVAGGGPAGLAAAIAASSAGFHVVLMDCQQAPIDKTCGEGLMPDALQALRKLGIALQSPPSGYPFRGIRFHGSDSEVDASFPLGAGLGMRRPLLHELLVERAIEAGVELRWNTRLPKLEDLRCRWIIGADGQNSQVRRQAGLDQYRHDEVRYGFRRHYRIAPWTDCMEIYWADGCQMYMTPVSAEEVCVVLISRDSKLRFAQAASRFPKLIERLDGAALVTPERGAVTASRRLKHLASGRVVLTGDASGSVDAITGEGMCMAFQQAPKIVEAMQSGDFAAYEKWHRKAMARPAFMANLMLTLDRIPALRERTIRALASKPEIFASMLAMHVGEISPARFVRRGMVPLSWRLLTT